MTTDDVLDVTHPQAKELMDLLARQEELDPELEAYWEETGPLGACIRHPLVYSMIHTPMQNAWANEYLRQKQDALERAVEAESWHSYVYLHERPWRLDAFYDIRQRLDDATYWNLLGGIWTDSENIWQNEKRWRTCLSSKRKQRECMMTDDERAALEHDYDNPIAIYRGFRHDGREEGLSWTTNSITAKWFARRLAQDGDPQYLAIGVVWKRNVLAFFDGRSESEMVVLPEHVMEMEVVEL